MKIMKWGYEGIKKKKTLKLEGMLGEGVKRFQYLRNIPK